MMKKKIRNLNPNWPLFIPWFDFDWYPAKEPYDIP